MEQHLQSFAYTTLKAPALEFDPIQAIQQLQQLLPVFEEAVSLLNHPRFKADQLQEWLNRYREEIDAYLHFNPEHEVDLGMYPHTDPEELKELCQRLRAKFNQKPQLSYLQRQTLSGPLKALMAVKIDGLTLNQLSQLDILDAFLTQECRKKRLRIILLNSLYAPQTASVIELEVELEKLLRLNESLQQLTVINRELRSRGLPEFSPTQMEWDRDLELLRVIPLYGEFLKLQSDIQQQKRDFQKQDIIGLT